MIKTPRFYLGAAVLFWGWQNGLLWMAFCLAVILESASMMRTRFELSPADFNKFVDISIVLLAGTFVAAMTLDMQKANMTLLRWLPLVFFPIIAAQEFSTKGRMDVKSFFLAARKKAEMRFYETKEIDVSYIYAFICLMSASYANPKGLVYLVAVAVFFSWGLWHGRSGRVSLALFLLSLCFALFLGYEGQKAARAAGQRIGQKLMAYYYKKYSIDPFKTYSALGEIGDLKLSDQIMLRVSFEHYIPGKTYLLHSATYNRFTSSNWFSGYPFERVEEKPGSTLWQINPKEPNLQKMTQYFRLQQGKAVLSLPPGVVDISEMKAGICEKNPVQAVRIEEGPSLIKAVVSYTGSAQFDALPGPHDRLVPEKEKPAFEVIAQRLGLEGQSEEEILKTVQMFFLSEFTYSLALKGKGSRSTALENFLTHTKSGHCEFFATAAVLLLREAGLPARYATGFIAHEYSFLEKALVVRQRDAHAWAKVFVKGQWRDIDTTPPGFLQIDAMGTKGSALADVFSFFGFKLSQLRHETGGKLMEAYGLWLILPLILILFFRLKRSGEIRRIKDPGREKKRKGQKEELQGFYLIEQMLNRKGFVRETHETYALWLRRISGHLGDPELGTRLFSMVTMHNQWRFGRNEEAKEIKRKLDEEAAVISEMLLRAGHPTTSP